MPRSSTPSPMPRLACLAALALAVAAVAKPPETAWRTPLEFPLGEAVHLSLDANGNAFACSGTVTTPGATCIHLFQVKKLAADGSLLWSRDYRPAGNCGERVYWTATDDEGNLFATGYDKTLQAAPDRMLLVKYAADGTLRWFRNEESGASILARGYFVETDPDGNAYVLGVGSATGGFLCVWKYAPDGTKVWERGITPAPGSITASVRSLAVDDDGRVTWAGTVSNNLQLVLVSIDPDGEVAWTRIENDFFSPSRIARLADGTTVVAGSMATPTGLRAAVAAYDVEGNRAWSEAFAENGLLTSAMTWVEQAPDGDLLVAGSGAISGHLYTGWVAARLAPDGTRRWSRVLPPPSGNDGSVRCCVADGDGMIVVGSTAPAPPYGPDSCTPPGWSGDLETTAIRFDAKGDTDWTKILGCSGRPGFASLTSTGGTTRLLATTPSQLAAIDLAPSTPSPDLDGNGVVDGADLAALLAAWGTASSDLDGDGLTGGADLAVLLGAWGSL